MMPNPLVLLVSLWVALSTHVWAEETAPPTAVKSAQYAPSLQQSNNIIPLDDNYAAAVLAKWQLLVVDCGAQNASELANGSIGRRYSLEQLGAFLDEHGLAVSRFLNLGDTMTIPDKLELMDGNATSEFGILCGSDYDARRDLYYYGGTIDRPVVLLQPKATGEHFEITLGGDRSGSGTVGLKTNISDTAEIAPPPSGDNIYRRYPELSRQSLITYFPVVIKGEIIDKDTYVLLGALSYDRQDKKFTERLFFLHITDTELWQTWPGYKMREPADPKKRP